MEEVEGCEEGRDDQRLGVDAHGGSRGRSPCGWGARILGDGDRVGKGEGWGDPAEGPGEWDGPQGWEGRRGGEGGRRRGKGLPKCGCCRAGALGQVRGPGRGVSRRLTRRAGERSGEANLRAPQRQVRVGGFNPAPGGPASTSGPAFTLSTNSRSRQKADGARAFPIGS